MSNKIDFVFDCSNGHPQPVFVEVEVNGKSIRIGEWTKRRDGLHALTITQEDFGKAQEQINK